MSKLDELDQLFAWYVKRRDRYTCQFCRKKFDPYSETGLEGLDCSHFHGRGKKSVRFDPDNCDSLCRCCHIENEECKEDHYTQFKIERLGLEKFMDLEDKANRVEKFGKFEQDEMKVTLIALLKSVGLDRNGREI